MASRIHLVRQRPVQTKESSIVITRSAFDDLGEETLRINHSILREILTKDDVVDKPVAFIGITGCMRTGKSFIMNFILRYLRQKGWENEGWMGDENTKADRHNDIEFRRGSDRHTTGLRIFHEKFEVPINNGKTMIVMIMDTQGLFDLRTPEQMNKAILTLSTMLCSVQIFNVVGQINAHYLHKLEVCVDFARESANQHKDDAILRLQRLMILIRDYPEEDESYFTLSHGKQKLDKILSSNKGGEQQVEVRRKIRSTFAQTDCYPLPFPGENVAKRNFEGKNKDLKEEFRNAVKSFVEEIAHPRKLIPKQARSGRFLTAREVLLMISACGNLFAEKMFNAALMVQKNIESYYAAASQETILKYRKAMESRRESIKDECSLKRTHNNTRRTILPRYDATSDYCKDIKDRYKKEIEDEIKKYYDDELKVLRSNQVERNVLVTWTQEELGEQKIRINSTKLHEMLIQPEIGEKPIAFIGITGCMRTGKSFILNYILRYLREKGWENKDWMGDGNSKADKDNDIEWKRGADRHTTGIRIFHEKFEVPIGNGKTMIVMIMDTQGLFDFNTPEQMNKAILTLSTMLCSVQIFNMVGQINAHLLHNLEVCVDFARESANQHNDDAFLRLQRLMILIRDYPEEEESYFTLSHGKQKLDEILCSEEGGKEQVKVRQKIRSTFAQTDCYPLPYPGEKVTKRNFEGKNKDLREEFRNAVKSFVEEIAHPRKLIPKQARSGRFLTAREVLLMISACGNLFAEKMLQAALMVQKNIESYYAAASQETILKYRTAMESWRESITDECTLKRTHSNTRRTILPRYDATSAYCKDIKDRYKKEIEDEIQKYYDDELKVLRSNQVERSVLVTRTQEELGEQKIRINSNTLRDMLIKDDIGEKPIAFIGITGCMRTGKSFILNYILRYLRKKGWENKDWMGDGNSKADKDNDIEWKRGADRNTTGIRIFHEKFEVPIENGKTVGCHKFRNGNSFQSKW